MLSDKTVIGGCAILALVAGIFLYGLAFRPRHTLDVPLISNHLKSFLGGCLFLGGAVILAYVIVKMN